MRPLIELAYRGIPDIHRPDIDSWYQWANYNALPTGVVYKDAFIAGNDVAGAVFEGLNGGRLGLPSVTSPAHWLRFEAWDLADPDIYRRVLFEIEGIYTPGTTTRYFFSLRDIINNTTHGLFYASRPGGTKGEITFNNGTAAVQTVVAFELADAGRNLRHSIGIGYEIDPFGTKYVLMTYNTKVCWRVEQPTLSLAGTLRPSLALHQDSSTATIYHHGARLRLWRHR